MHTLIPVPAEFTAGDGTFALRVDTSIVIAAADPELAAIAQQLATWFGSAVGGTLSVSQATEFQADGQIYLALDGAQDLGAEGYTLTISATGVRVVAAQAAGAFYGIQTLRQLVPPAAINDTVVIPACTIRDHPRFAWRGAMLDVSRHFFSVDDVKRYIDLLASYKLNRLHLHLSDDQGWRIAIHSWPNLAEYGGKQQQVGGGVGGYYTQAEYTDIIAYAQQRYITIIPEIDMPGHTNAALSAYPELNRDSVAPPPYTGTAVGFSTLWIDRESTARFIDDVLRELAALTPGPYLHIGGDESDATPHDDYVRFIELFQHVVHTYGKHMIGWEEIARVPLAATSVVQYWREAGGGPLSNQGVQVIMSPASRAYLDMKYDQSTELGLHWAGYINVQCGYDWDPATHVAGITESSILGIEAPLFSETLLTMRDVEFMTFPRVLGYAEIGWSPQALRDWESYRLRLATHGPRLTALGVNFFRSEEVPWL